MHDIMMEIDKMAEMAKQMDLHLAKMARQAMEEGSVELQMATVTQPFTGEETLRVFMQEAENPKNYVYAMRYKVAQDPTAGDCFLSIMAKIAIEFNDTEMQKLIEENPSAGMKTKGVFERK